VNANQDVFLSLLIVALHNRADIVCASFLPENSADSGRQPLPICPLCSGVLVSSVWLVLLPCRKSSEFSSMIRCLIAYII